MALLSGILISLMLSINGVLSGETGPFISLLIINTAGLAVSSLILLVGKEKKKGSGAPFFLNAGGFIGVLLLLFNNRCFSSLGATMTLSLGIISQSILSTIVDSFGFFGMDKRRFDRKKMIGLLLLFAGAVFMIDDWRGRWFDILLAMISGGIVVVTLIMNGRLADRIGIFHGVRRNFIGGIAGSLLLLLFSGDYTPGSFAVLSFINPIFLFGGGILGVLIVAVNNSILPKIPVMYTTVLLFGGQAIGGMLIDYILTGQISLRKSCGVMIILSGLIYILIMEKRSERFPDIGRRTET